jgi:hypothetical protein
VLTAALVAALVLRVVPMIAYMNKPCVRDECTYLELAGSIESGRGMVGSHGWLWAPAYPFLMALHSMATGYGGTIEITQLAVSLASMWILYDLTEREYGKKAARIAVWLYAVNPTYIFYTTSLWSECIYSGLLLGAMLALRWAREGGWRRGWVPGLLVGLMVLFRGVAQYILPIFAVALLAGRWRQPDARRAAVLCALTTVLTVVPYSAYATHKFGGFVLSDRTLGQMMWLGDNDFPPMTFDVGNGTLAKRAYNDAVDMGRPHCDFEKNPVVQDDCEVQNGKAWILANPGEFAARIPMRVAQLVNPHSFLTRHLRWGRWAGLPDWIDETLVLVIVELSFLTLVGGTIGLFALGRGWYALTTGLIVLYHVAAIAVLAGLSRYRMPLEPLWLVFASGLLAEPRAAFAALGAHSTRASVCIVVTLVLVSLMLWYLPSGWPGWRSW